MVNKIHSFDVKVDRRAKSPKFTVYAVGKPDCHLMDWRGCNFRRIKMPGQPRFSSLIDAVSWAERWMRTNHDRSIGGTGSHISDYEDSDALGFVNSNYYRPEKIHEIDRKIRDNWDIIREKGLDWVI